MGLGKFGIRLAGSGALVALGFGLGSLLNHRLSPAAASPADDARMRAVIEHERAKGNGVVEADVTASKPAVVDLPKDTFAVFAAPTGAPTDSLVLDGGNRTGAATLVRLAKGALPNAGLSARWEGHLTVRLTSGAPAAHLAFFSAAPSLMKPGARPRS